MKAFLICADHEQNRNLEAIEASYPFAVQRVEAIYPSRQKVPFVDRLISVSKERTGKALMPGELGCLMSHRKVWRADEVVTADSLPAHLSQLLEQPHHIVYRKQPDAQWLTPFARQHQSFSTCS